MIIIPVKKTQGCRVQFTVEENATPGTLGSHMLLIQQYKELEWQESESFKRLQFHTEFLQEILHTHGELHCEYCGKQHLKIYNWNDKNKSMDDMATVDHFIPRSKAPELQRVKSNMKVSCFNCNTNKKDKEWAKERIKYPY